MDKQNNEFILQYFENAIEVAKCINKSPKYARERIKKTGDKDFTLQEWELINKHINEVKKQKSRNNTDINHKIALLHRQLAEAYEELANQ